MVEISRGTEVSLFFSATTTTQSSPDGDGEERPYVVVYLDDAKIGATEAVKVGPTMTWSSAVAVVFRFEQLQVVRLEVVDRRAETGEKDELIGSCRFPLGNLMSRPARTLVQPLKGLHSFALETGAWQLKIQAEQGSMQLSGSLEFQLRARKLGFSPWLPFGRPNAFFVISRTLQTSAEVVPVYESEVVAGNRNPVWRLVERRLSALCNSNLDLILDVSVYDKKGDNKSLIGTAHLSVNDLVRSMRSGGNRTFQLLHPVKRSFIKAKQRNAGILTCSHAKLKSNPTARALEYIAGGLFIDSVFAIDFTASNGDPRHPRSLHYRYGHGANAKTKLNEYQRAILGVGKILMEYDSTREFPCYGFGGSIDGETSHCFALNGNPRRPTCSGIEGVLAAYDDSFRFASLSGPTNFAAIVREARRIAASTEVSQEYQQYTILVILTDGVITDFEETVEAIVEASKQPLSIVIVGVGDASFEEMEYLDGDTSKLTDMNGNKALRDIVQFVPFSQCASDERKLAEQTLAELPAQIVSFFESRNIVPNPPKEASRSKTDSMSAIIQETKYSPS